MAKGDIAKKNVVVDVSEEDMQQLKDAAARVGFAVPTTSEQAEIFLQAVMGLNLYRSEGLYAGETKGEIVGWLRKKWEKHGPTQRGQETSSQIRNWKCKECKRQNTQHANELR